MVYLYCWNKWMICSEQQPAGRPIAGTKEQSQQIGWENSA